MGLGPLYLSRRFSPIIPQSRAKVSQSFPPGRSASRGFNGAQMKIALTDSAIKVLKVPNGRVELGDATCRGPVYPVCALGRQDLDVCLQARRAHAPDHARGVPCPGAQRGP
jgi:hypothetical protein